MPYLDGQALLIDPRRTVELRPRASVFYFQSNPPLAARRRAHERHRFITVEFSAKFLRQHLRKEARNLHNCLQAVVEPGAPGRAPESVVGHQSR